MTNATSAPTASTLSVIEKIDFSGSRHLATPSRHGMGWVTFCTGRTMSMTVPVTGAPVTCKACTRKASAAGIDVREVAQIA